MTQQIASTIPIGTQIALSSGDWLTAFINTPRQAYTVVIQAPTVTSRCGRCFAGPSPARAKIANANARSSNIEMNAMMRFTGGSGPSVNPPCVATPHGAPNTSASWNAAIKRNNVAAIKDAANFT